MKKAKVEAIKRGLSLKGFVVEAIQVRCGEPIGLRKPRAAKTEDRIEVVAVPVAFNQETKSGVELIPGEKCHCGAGVHEVVDVNTRVRKWKCVGMPTHTMTPKEEKV